MVAVSRQEMETLGLSRVFSVDRQFGRDVSGLCRVVVFGWGIEIYRPNPAFSCSENSRASLIAGKAKRYPHGGVPRKKGGRVSSCPDLDLSRASRTMSHIRKQGLSF